MHFENTLSIKETYIDNTISILKNVKDFSNLIVMIDFDEPIIISVIL